jgi:hypothetical protein
MTNDQGLAVKQIHRGSIVALVIGAWSLVICVSSLPWYRGHMPASFPITLFVAALLAAAATYLVIRVSRPGITDSAWFWVFVFCTIGLIGVVVISPKYDDRQKRLEARYEGRQRIAARSQAQDPSSSTAGAADATDSTEEVAVPHEQTAAEQHGYADERRVPLVYLGGVLFLASVASGYMLWRSERKPASAAGHRE